MSEDLALEFLDEDLPDVVTATYNGSSTIVGKFSRQFVETDSYAGLRSTFLCSLIQSESVPSGATLTIGAANYEIEVRQPEGVAFCRFILSQ